MKYLSTLILFCLFTLTVNAQTQADAIAALKAGDANKIGLSLDNDVEICFDDKVDFLSKAQAIKILTKFFSDNKPVSYAPLHNGSAKGDKSGYTIGKLTTGSKNYRVYIFAQRGNGAYKIQEIRFDTEE